MLMGIVFAVKVVSALMTDDVTCILLGSISLFYRVCDYDHYMTFDIQS